MSSLSVEIVLYRPDHGAAWRSLNETWILAGGYTLEASDLKVLDDPEGSILSLGGVIFIAEQDGRGVGCCSLIPMDDGGFEVGKMAVSAEAQGLGLGRKLLEACEAHARAAGATRLYLVSNTAQTHAIALYRRLGFIDLPAQPTPYVRANCWMEKPL